MVANKLPGDARIRLTPAATITAAQLAAGDDDDGERRFATVAYLISGDIAGSLAGQACIGTGAGDAWMRRTTRWAGPAELNGLSDGVFFDAAYPLNRYDLRDANGCEFCIYASSVLEAAQQEPCNTAATLILQSLGYSLQFYGDVVMTGPGGDTDLPADAWHRIHAAVYRAQSVIANNTPRGADTDDDALPEQVRQMALEAATEEMNQYTEYKMKRGPTEPSPEESRIINPFEPTPPEPPTQYQLVVGSDKPWRTSVADDAPAIYGQELELIERELAEAGVSALTADGGADAVVAAWRRWYCIAVPNMDAGSRLGGTIADPAGAPFEIDNRLPEIYSCATALEKTMYLWWWCGRPIPGLPETRFRAFVLLWVAAAITGGEGAGWEQAAAKYRAAASAIDAAEIAAESAGQPAPALTAGGEQ